MFHRSHILSALWLACCSLVEIAHAQTTQDVTVTFEPSIPLIEHRDGRQLLNFDLVVVNRGGHRLRLTEIEVSVFDSAGNLVMRKAVNSNGLAPGIEAVARPQLDAGEIADIFNPFYSLAEELPVGRMEYALRYQREDTGQQHDRNEHRLPMDYDMEARAEVAPVAYRTKTSLILPLTGRVFIWDGHDFYSHHRRVPLDTARVRQMGLQANSNRYGADLVIMDEQGRLYHGTPYDKRNWYTYGAVVYAPGNGKVVAAANDVPDNKFDGTRIVPPAISSKADPILGNYVLIDHGNGEFSVFPHMMPGSVAVKAGDSVHQGDRIGRVGFSGDSLFPHVHYSLLAGKPSQSEGIPAYFTRFRRLLGSKTTNVGSGTLDSGDIVESTAHYSGTNTASR
jgi:murein DD-endopeptidase MepM/ murein hydrolase activator NlpD